MPRKSVTVKYLKTEEIERLFAALAKFERHKLRNIAIFRLAYHCGLRASEVGMLELRDYDARTDRLDVRRLKGSLGGTIHLPRKATNALRSFLRERGAVPGPLFASQKGRPISRKELDRLMKRAAAAANLPPGLAHFHVLKHSCATHLLERGLGVEDVQDWLGHAAISSTMIYAAITNPRRDRAARQVQDW